MFWRAVSVTVIIMNLFADARLLDMFVIYRCDFVIALIIASVWQTVHP